MSEPRIPSIAEQCIALYGKKSATIIARDLQIKRSTVHRHWHRARMNGQLPPPKSRGGRPLQCVPRGENPESRKSYLISYAARLTKRAEGLLEQAARLRATASKITTGEGA